jgi:SAM-dependent methyltransferase
MIRSILRNSGFRPKALLSAWRGWRRFTAHRRAFLAMPGANTLPWGRELPILTEWDDASGGLGAYFIQDLIAARWVKEISPARHVDVGSRIDGFIGHLAVFREVEVIDIRPPPGEIPGVRFHQFDLMAALADEWQESADLVSCLHSIEHFGLGRYGDSIDPRGHETGLARLKEMVSPGGRLILSVPIGPERVEFNAHRIFAASTLLNWFRDGWEIEQVAVIDDSARAMENPERNEHSVAAHFGCRSGVGMVAARRIPARPSRSPSHPTESGK